MLVVHQEKVVEQNFGFDRFKQWLDEVYGVLQVFYLNEKQIEHLENIF